MYEEVVSMVDGGIMVYKEFSGVVAHFIICIRLLVSTLIWGLGSGIWDMSLTLLDGKVLFQIPDPCGTVTRRVQSDSNCKVILPD